MSHIVKCKLLRARVDHLVHFKNDMQPNVERINSSYIKFIKDFHMIQGL